jgi:hypothetical protein
MQHNGSWDRAMPQLVGGRRLLIALSALLALGAAALLAQPCAAEDDAYRPSEGGDAYPDDGRALPPYRPSGVYREDDDYRRSDEGQPMVSPAPRGPEDSARYGEPYHPPGEYNDRPPDDGSYDSYSQNEILAAGHRFFGSVSKGLASVVEYAFSKSGRPNGYILGEDAGGAFVAGLRYGEGTLYTKDAGIHKVYWQGPSVGYDFGGEGSRTMVLVYNLRDPSQIFHRYAGVQGSAYFVGGVGIQYQTHGNVTLAPIRAGIGLRLGANVGYLKYTRSPTWNPF